ncbi:MAG: hypothetical protein FWH05_05040 [Oscillospiraceae bacterium]|nr:hypothetical protein [Oscillospiraceae bacterium]
MKENKTRKIIIKIIAGALAIIVLLGALSGYNNIFGASTALVATTNPTTGVELAIYPAVAALVVLIIITIFKRKK